MPDEPKDTQAQRERDEGSAGEGLARSPQDTRTGAVRPRAEGPMERPGTEAEEAARRKA
ncbi:hypothetical protein Q8W71_16245 [Methylobacterium sp. NEAU 140]|uniref:hypothetical protein n=1 Tax=Methylobacterium sp. NEAU 140 TaxID=3064945 RepID=UPI002733ADDE|nr:hypothetical protein [Methylobacterium sp. NEAU 140]MDP4024180.1 hypothetical protein [Methylobacterium sp. NEAU 140]